MHLDWEIAESAPYFSRTNPSVQTRSLKQLPAFASRIAKKQEVKGLTGYY